MLMGSLEVAWRPKKPRTAGITIVNDRGIGRRSWKDTIEMAGDYVDIVKLSIGTAYVMQNLQEKLFLLRQSGIEVVLGGTLFETFWAQNRIHEYLQLLETLKFNWVEISSGSYEIPMAEKVELVKMFSQRFQVMAEVGSKDPDLQPSPSALAREAKSLHEAGAQKIIIEGRGSGTGGIYDQDGQFDDSVIDLLTQMVPVQNLIFEAPQEQQQIAFIQRFGPNVNLGNIPFEDILMLETQRVGLRFDTHDASVVSNGTA